MNNEQTCHQAVESESLVLTQVIVCSCVLMGVLAIGSWFVVDWSFARSLLIGAILVNASFLLLRYDAQRLLQRLSMTETAGSAVANAEKMRFFLRVCARLVALGLILFALAAHMPIDVIGLTLGCATIVASIVIIGLSAGRRWMPSKV